MSLVSSLRIECLLAAEAHDGVESVRTRPEASA